MPSSFVVEMPGHAPFEVLLEGVEVVTVGRAEDNVLPLRDMNVSRHHFAVEARPPLGWVLCDRNSRNGTVVNGVSVMDKVLGEGDRVQVGSSCLTFKQVASSQALPLSAVQRAQPARTTAPLPPERRSDPPRPPALTMKMPTSDLPTRARSETPPAMVRPHRSTEGLSPPSEVGSGVGTIPTATPSRTPAGTKGFSAAPAAMLVTNPGETMPRATGRDGDASRDPPTRPGPDTQRWRKLAEVACAINLEHDTEKLLERILDAVLSLVPSNSAFLVLVEGDRLNIRVNRNAPQANLDDDSGEYRLSRQVCKEAIAQKRPVLTQDAASDTHLGQFASVMSMRLHSILCVPFSYQGEVLGVVYLDQPQVDPFADNGEVVELVAAFGDLAGIALANARMVEEMANRERLEEELRIAGRIQGKLLPAAAPRVQGLEVAGKTVAARHVGGDIYDFIPREKPEKELLISIGDVSGKGIGAGLVMSTVRSLLRAFAEVHDRTDEILVHANHDLNRDLEPGLFVSLLLLRYHEPTGRLAYTGAGHEHLVFYRPSTRQLEFLRAGGVVLGLAADVRGRLQERQILLQPGDVVALYTDGATEARDPRGEELGLERLGKTIQAGALDPQAVVDRLIQTVIDHTGPGRELDDDLTVVVLRKT